MSQILKCIAAEPSRGRFMRVMGRNVSYGWYFEVCQASLTTCRISFKLWVVCWDQFAGARELGT